MTQLESILLIPESDTRMRGYLADLYAGTILFILGLTPGKLVHDEGERIPFK